MNRNSALNVTLIAKPDGELTAALAAKLCYSNATIGALSEKLSSKDQSDFLEKISTMGHHSVFEHLSFTFGVEGVSRALTHQLVRHRLASYSQKSQRYVAHKSGFDYVTPPTIANDLQKQAEYDATMDQIAKQYDRLVEMGIPAEDARYILPNACETKIIMTMNARELLHFFTVRCCNRAQWEILEMATEMYRLVLPIAPSIFASAGPSCVRSACSEGKMTCGKASEVREKFKTISSL